MGTAFGLALVTPLATAGRSPDLESPRSGFLSGFLATRIIAGLEAAERSPVRGGS
jgi:hypothetical protein